LGVAKQQHTGGNCSLENPSAIYKIRNFLMSTINVKPVKSPAAMVRVRDLLGIVPFSAATIWRRVRAGTFPAPVKISKGITAWRLADIEAWLAEQGTAAS
jgi:predicted DNA-binding transcriptional regulator AlpA